QPARGDWVNVLQRVAADLGERPPRGTATPLSLAVMPAKAGTQGQPTGLAALDSHLRGNDGKEWRPGKGRCDRPERKGEGAFVEPGVFAEALRLHQAGRLREAESLYRRVLAADSGHGATHYNLGLLLQAQDRLKEAAASYQRALALNPDYVDAH